MVPKARYTLDFRLIPETIQNQAETFIKSCLQHREEYMAYLFNNYFQNICIDNRIQYTPGDFCITENKMSGKDRILYIELPQQYYDSTVYCTAYAIAYSTSMFGKIQKARFFSVEGSVFGTGCIGSVHPNGQHINYGDAFPSRGENLTAIYKLYK